MKKEIETIRVASNQRQRTFTIRKYINGKLFTKYRTIQLSQQEFDRESHNTENDWKQFLKSDNYYIV